MEIGKRTIASTVCAALCIHGIAQITPSGQSYRTSLGGADLCLYAENALPSMSVKTVEPTSIVWTFAESKDSKADTLAMLTDTVATQSVSRPGLYGVVLGNGAKYEMWWLSPRMESANYAVDSMDCDYVYVTGFASGEAVALGGDTLKQSFVYEWSAGDSVLTSSNYSHSELEGLYDKTDLKLTVSNLAGNTFVVSDSISPLGVKAAFEFDKREKNILNEVTSTGEAISAPTEVVFTNKSLGGYTVSEWAMGRVSRLYDKSPVYQFQQPGTYVIALTVTNEDSGCASVDSTTKITVSEAALGFPSAFTPNDDGMNDKFCPAFRSLKSYELTVYNRWGRKVFSSTDPTEGWDGKEGNRVAAAGVYYYISKAEGYEKGITFYRKGSVTLIR